MKNLVRSSTYYVEPGYIYFSKKPAMLRAVVGTCVAVCLWDTKLGHGGMNHFLMPKVTERERATPRYGNVAVAALIRIMEEAGSKREHLIAQNVLAARESLTRKGIPIVSEDTGGMLGRKIVFDTRTGELAVLKVHQIRDSDWYA